MAQHNTAPSGEFEHRGDGLEKEWRWVPKSEFQGKWQSWSWGHTMDDDDDWHQRGWQDWGNDDDGRGSASNWHGHAETGGGFSHSGPADPCHSGPAGPGTSGPGHSAPAVPGQSGCAGHSGHAGLAGPGHSSPGVARFDPYMPGPAYVDVGWPEMAADAARRYAEAQTALQEQARLVRNALEMEEFTAHLAREDETARGAEAEQEAMVAKAAALATEVGTEVATSKNGVPFKASPPFLLHSLPPGVVVGPGGPPPARSTAPPPFRTGNTQNPKPAVVPRTK